MALVKDYSKPDLSFQWPGIASDENFHLLVYKCEDGALRYKFEGEWNSDYPLFYGAATRSHTGIGWDNPEYFPPDSVAWANKKILELETKIGEMKGL